MRLSSLIKIILVLAFLVYLASCQSSKDSQATPAPAPSLTPSPTPENWWDIPCGCEEPQ